ncbi:DUF397 domain-containing protein [Sphaerisporangium corydalis]|uniref:DUF397 domain-containing protein n=1 Tax=Sphaerisporangium corydalis TaxID=1441875 RepID=A0ABV9ECX8_9ACTN|nr:DUF397 domain-containing protein [Sphaerisporangium corydalis]
MDLSNAEWRKSSWSSGDGGQCVEVATNIPGLVAIRDSKVPHGSALVVLPAQWGAFLQRIRTGDRDY